MKLYYSPGACSLSPHIVLREAGLPVDLVRVNLGAKRTQAGDDYSAINPKGYVPALELPGGGVLTEGPAIVQYIADQVPARGLAPAAGSVERYRLQEWLNFISTELHKQYSPLFDKAASEDLKTRQRERIAGRLAFIVNALKGHDYLMGSAFTVADAYLFTVLGWSGMVGVELPAALVAYCDRIRARPAVLAALKAEGLVKE
jgi:glutathione S-transferase